MRVEAFLGFYCHPLTLYTIANTYYSLGHTVGDFLS